MTREMQDFLDHHADAAVVALDCAIRETRGFLDKPPHYEVDRPFWERELARLEAARAALLNLLRAPIGR
jgi:hypothetical protein